MLVVSNYHYIREDFSARHPSIFGLTPKQFQAQLAELSGHGSFISRDELLEFRHKPLNKNYILITFDDGLKEQYELAKPILDEMGIPFIFFINTANFRERKLSLVHKIHLLRSRISSRELLRELNTRSFGELTTREKTMATAHYNYDQEQTAEFKYLLNFKMSVREQQEFISPLFSQLFDEEKTASDLYFDQHMLQALHRQNVLGSHSDHHLPLGQLSEEKLKKELQNTQDFFSSNFGKSAEVISYPYGSPEACLGISEETEKAGFRIGFTMERAVNESLQQDSLLLSRFDCNDLPLGKNDLFKGENIFNKPLSRNWYKNENSAFNQR